MRLIFKLLTVVFMISTMSILFACGKKEKVELISIEVDQSTISNDVIYDEFNLETIKLILNQSDGSTNIVSLTESMLSHMDLDKLLGPGTHQIEVVYEGFTTEFNITLKDYPVNEKLLKYFNFAVKEELKTGDAETWISEIRNQYSNLKDAAIKQNGHLALIKTDETTVDLGQFISQNSIEAYGVYGDNHSSYNGSLDHWVNQVIDGALSNVILTITLDLDEGYVLPEGVSKTINITKGDTIELPQPVEQDYAFIGWFNENDELFTKTTPVMTHLTLEAQFSTVPYLTDQPVTITFWHPMGSRMESLLRTYADEFEALYPNVTIILQTKGGYSDLYTHVIKGIETNNEPTLTVGYANDLFDYIQLDAIEALDAYVSHPDYGVDLTEFIQSFIEENQSYSTNETLYGLPFSKSTEVLIYNKTLFDQYNLETPSTWSEFETIAATIKQYKDSDDEWVLGYDYPANLFMTLGKQWGAPYTSVDETGNGHLLYDHIKTKEMLAYIKSLHDSNYITLPETWQQQYSDYSIKEDLLFMSVSSSIGAYYSIPSDHHFEIGIAPIPQKDSNNPYVIQRGSNFTIMESASEQEKLAAWLFTKYLTSEEVTTDWGIKSGYIPVRTSALESSEYQAYLNYSGTDPLEKCNALAAKAAYQQINHLFFEQPFDGSKEVSEDVASLVRRILFEAITIDTAIYDAINGIKEPDDGIHQIESFKLLAKAGEEYTVKAIVTGINTQSKGFYLDDGTGAIYAYYGSDVPSISVGDEILINAKYYNYYGAPELGNITYEVLSSGNALPTPITKSLSDFNTTGTRTMEHSQYVRLENIIITETEENGVYQITQNNITYKVEDLTDQNVINNYVNQIVNINVIADGLNNNIWQFVYMEHMGDIEVVNS